MPVVMYDFVWNPETQPEIPMDWPGMAPAAVTLFFIMELLVLLATQMLLNGFAEFVGTL